MRTSFYKPATDIAAETVLTSLQLCNCLTCVCITVSLSVIGWGIVYLCVIGWGIVNLCVIGWDIVYLCVIGWGSEYPAVVEFAPFLKVPKKRTKKPNPRKGTIESG